MSHTGSECEESRSSELPLLPPFIGDWQCPTQLACCAQGCHHRDARLGLLRPEVAVPSCASALSPGPGVNLPVTGLTTAVLGQRPVLCPRVSAQPTWWKIFKCF